MEAPRSCLTCHKPIKGRVDKKFCSDYCRATYRNAKQKKAPAYVHFVNQKLLKNRSVLAALNPKGKQKVSRSDLQNRGFQWGYHTNVYRTQAGMVYYFCYDYGYSLLHNDYVLLVQLQPYTQAEFENRLPDELISSEKMP